MPLNSWFFKEQRETVQPLSTTACSVSGCGRYFNWTNGQTKGRFLGAKVGESGGEFGDGFEEQIGFRGAEAFGGGKWAEDSDGCAYSGATGHLQVFGRVADVDGFFWMQAHVAKGE